MAFKYNIIKAFEDERVAGIAIGRADSIIDLLEELGPVSDHLRETIRAQKDMAILKTWHKQAARADSIHEFECFLKENFQFNNE